MFQLSVDISIKVFGIDETKGSCNLMGKHLISS